MTGAVSKDTSKIRDDIFDIIIRVSREGAEIDELVQAVESNRNDIQTYVQHAVHKLESNLEGQHDAKLSLMKLMHNLARGCEDDFQSAKLLEEELRLAKHLDVHRSAHDALGFLVIIHSKLGNQSIARKYSIEREMLKSVHLTRFPFNPRSRPRRGSCKYYRKSDGLCNKVNYSLVCPFNARVSECPIGKSRRRKKDTLTTRLGGLGREAARGYVVDVLKWVIGTVVLLLLAHFLGLLSMLYEWFVSVIP